MSQDKLSKLNHCVLGILTASKQQLSSDKWPKLNQCVLGIFDQVKTTVGATQIVNKKSNRTRAEFFLLWPSVQRKRMRTSTYATLTHLYLIYFCVSVHYYFLFNSQRSFFSSFFISQQRQLPLSSDATFWTSAFLSSTPSRVVFIVLHPVISSLSTYI